MATQKVTLTFDRKGYPTKQSLEELIPHYRQGKFFPIRVPRDYKKNPRLIWTSQTVQRDWQGFFDWISRYRVQFGRQQDFIPGNADKQQLGLLKILPKPKEL